LGVLGQFITTLSQKQGLDAEGLEKLCDCKVLGPLVEFAAHLSSKSWGHTPKSSNRKVLRLPGRSAPPLPSKTIAEGGSLPQRAWVSLCDLLQRCKCKAKELGIQLASARSPASLLKASEGLRPKACHCSVPCSHRQCVLSLPNKSRGLSRRLAVARSSFHLTGLPHTCQLKVEG
jgi:hypothetical protein